MKKRVILTSIFVLSFTLCFFYYLALFQFHLTNRGVWKDTIEDFSAYYEYTTLTWTTLGWYLISGLMIWFVIQRSKQSNGGWRKWIITTGLIALLLAPAIFVDPDQAPALHYLKSAARFEAPSSVLPAWVSILGYWIKAPYLLYGVGAMLISLWPISLTWFVLLGLSVSIKVTRDFLGHKARGCRGECHSPTVVSSVGRSPNAPTHAVK